jgi:divalent metal cation (Fe/Co/Zn/Cd) transporter
MKANAWHHRADAVSSLVALVGVGKSFNECQQFHFMRKDSVMFLNVKVVGSLLSCILETKECLSVQFRL